MTQPHPTRFHRPTVAPAAAEPADRSRRDDSSHAVGWIVFAAIALALVGVLNGLYGIAAIAGSKFYVQDTEYVLGSLESFGWMMLGLGVLQWCAAVGVVAFAQWARWVGVASAAVNALLQLLVMPAAPFLALALLVLDVLVMYGLITYGQRWRTT